MTTIRIKTFNEDHTEVIFKEIDARPMVKMDPYDIARHYEVSLKKACHMKNDAMLAIYDKDKLKTRRRNFGSAGTRHIYELR